MATIHGDKSKYLIRREKIAWFLFQFSFLIFILLSILQITFSLKYKGENLLQLFVLLVFAGISIYLYLYAKKKAIEGVNFFHGRKGEYAIFYELNKLSRDFHILQGIEFKLIGNIDFVVISSNKIFAVEVKSHKGVIDLKEGRLVRYGKPFEKDFLKQVKHQALSLHKFIKEKINEDIYVAPIIVFSNSKARLRFGLNQVAGVYVVGKSYLRKAIFKEKGNFSKEKIERIKNMLLKEFSIN